MFTITRHSHRSSCYNCKNQIVVNLETGQGNITIVPPRNQKAYREFMDMPIFENDFRDRNWVCGVCDTLNGATAHELFRWSTK